MTHKRVFSLAAAVGAILFIGGTLLVVVQAQQPASGLLPPTKAANDYQNRAVYPTPAGFGAVPGMMSMGMGVAVIDDDPEMAELVQAEAILAHESGEIVQRFAESDNAPDRKKITAELRETLARQFDVQRKRRELELGRIEEQVRKLRDQIKKRDDARETIIDRRLDQLVNEFEGLGWASPAGPRPQAGHMSWSGSSSSDSMKRGNGTPAAKGPPTGARR
jgi:hypothetical protein